ncbi:hypothetical protein AVEN_100393-1 [Araneus ventricosus]|uniref:STPR domain-containing protein n=1 Tax=Araneus ventricosus TaxID=182803 RepID=A0A4Y2FLA5_ARAVE|nr:hypothetical protein AVEN_73423-1 [Araneus ventricosus]GBM42252.1 hypothetical protein AVEN_100393-1 [Araneus ventricosus]
MAQRGQRRRAEETDEQRNSRLAVMGQRSQERRAEGTDEQRNSRLSAMKSNVYVGGDPTLTTLKDNILRAVLSIPGDMLLSAVDTVVYRMQCVVQEKDGHIERCLMPWCIVISSL